jgi:hypothetical protein
VNERPGLKNVPIDNPKLHQSNVPEREEAGWHSGKVHDAVDIANRKGSRALEP